MLRMTWRMYQRRECVFDRRRVHLTPLEAEVLSVLLMRRGQVVPTSDLIEGVWPDPDSEPDRPEQNLRTHISRLRGKLPGTIEVLWCQGCTIRLPGAEPMRIIRDAELPLIERDPERWSWVHVRAA